MATDTNAPMSGSPAERMKCLEVCGGSQLTARGLVIGGLDAWVYSRPHGQSPRGGDVYYASSCAAGRITRLLLADVSGHGKTVAGVPMPVTGFSGDSQSAISVVGRGDRGRGGQSSGGRA